MQTYLLSSASVALVAADGSYPLLHAVSIQRAVGRTTLELIPVDRPNRRAQLYWSSLPFSDRVRLPNQPSAMEFESWWQSDAQKSASARGTFQDATGRLYFWQEANRGVFMLRSQSAYLGSLSSQTNGSHLARLQLSAELSQDARDVVMLAAFALLKPAVLAASPVSTPSGAEPASLAYFGRTGPSARA